MLLVPILITVFSLSVSSAEAFQGIVAVPNSHNYYISPTSEDRSPLEFFSELNRVRQNFVGPTRIAKKKILLYLASQGINVNTWQDVESRHRISYVVNDNLKPEVVIDINGRQFTFGRVKGEYLSQTKPD